MRIEHIVYLGAGGGALYTRSGAGFAPVPATADGAADAGQLLAALSALRPGPVAVLVDVIDEEHVRDTVARIGGRDQRALVARKLARAFPRTPFRSAQPQGRNPRNPDEDRVLLTALTKPAELRALLDRCAAARVPVAGVFSPALLAHRLLDADTLAGDAVLLATRQGDGSVRHSFFRQGALAGSRLLRQAAAGDAQRAVRQLEESLRYFDPAYAADAARPLRVLLPPAQAAAICGGGAPPEHWSVAPFDLAAACARAGIRAPVPDGRAELAWVGLLGRHGGADDLAPAADRRYFRLFRVRSVAKVACLAVAAGALVGTLLNALYIFDSGQRLAGSSATVQRLEAVLPAADAAGAAGVDPLEMQRAVAAFEALARHQLEPEDVLAGLGEALGARPRIGLDAVAWSGDPPAGEATAGAQADEGMADAVPAADGVVVTVRGHVRPFDGDFPLAFDEVEAFRAALAAVPGVEATRVTAAPIDVSPASTLSGEVARGAEAATASFTLEFVMRFADDAA
jgi:hypothetical protein